MRALRICLIASGRFPVAEPFAGGLEAHTHALARQLIRRGHRVTVYAGPGTDPELGARLLDVDPHSPAGRHRADLGSSPQRRRRESRAYRTLMRELARAGEATYDVVHNNSLHPVPVAMAGALPVPMVTTLHTPPLPSLVSAVRVAARHTRFVAVSDSVGRAWAHATASTVVHNGVDVEAWRPGPGGDRAVWSGRIVPEKAPHLAIEGARRAGLALDLAGPVHDPRYFRREIAPRLGSDVRVLGHLSRDALAEVVGRSRVALVTPAWEEPYGLVAAEAMACGTPVAALRRGAMGEVVDDETGRLAPPGDLEAFGRAISDAAVLDRERVRRRAVTRFDLARMVDEYERVYRSMSGAGRVA